MISASAAAMVVSVGGAGSTASLGPREAGRIGMEGAWDQPVA